MRATVRAAAHRRTQRRTHRRRHRRCHGPMTVRSPTRPEPGSRVHRSWSEAIFGVVLPESRSTCPHGRHAGRRHRRAGCRARRAPPGGAPPDRPRTRVRVRDRRPCGRGAPRRARARRRRCGGGPAQRPRPAGGRRAGPHHRSGASRRGPRDRRQPGHPRAGSPTTGTGRAVGHAGRGRARVLPRPGQGAVGRHARPWPGAPAAAGAARGVAPRAGRGREVGMAPRPAGARRSGAPASVRRRCPGPPPGHGGRIPGPPASRRRRSPVGARLAGEARIRVLRRSAGDDARRARRPRPDTSGVRRSARDRGPVAGDVDRRPTRRSPRRRPVARSGGRQGAVAVRRKGGTAGRFRGRPRRRRGSRSGTG